MKILITGGLGFIGNHLVRYLSNHHEVTSFDVKEENHNLDELIARILNSEFSIIFHLGAYTNTNTNYTEELHVLNVEITMKIARAAQFSKTKFLFASSLAIYGNSNGNLNSYASSKLLAENLLLQLKKDNPYWDLYITRFSNVFGTDESKKGAMASIPYQFVNSARYKNTIEVWAIEMLVEKIAKRDFIFIDDLTLNLVKFTETRNLANTIYEIGSGISTSILDIATYISAKIPCEIEICNFPTNLKSEYYQIKTKANLKSFLSDFSKVECRQIFEGIDKLL